MEDDKVHKKDSTSSSKPLTYENEYPAVRTSLMLFPSPLKD